MKKKESVESLIESSGLKKTFIADKMGITPATLSRKIKTPSTFNGVQMAKLANIFGVNIINIDFGVTFFNHELELNSSYEKTKIKQEV